MGAIRSTLAQMVAKADRPGVRAFFLSMAALSGALLLALYSSAAAELGQIVLASTSALAALAIAGWVAVTLVPTLARRTPLRWIGYRIQYKISREGWIYFVGLLLVALAALNTGNNLLFLILACDFTVVVVLRLWATSLNPVSTVAGAIGLVEETIRIAGVAGFGILILLFPTGRLPSRRWRPAVGLLAVTALLGGAPQQALTPGVIDGLPPVHNPWATASTGRIANALAPLGAMVVIAFLAAAASLVVRYRRAGRAEREQIKLFAIAVVFVVVLIVGLSVGLPKQMNGLLGSLVWQLPFILPPAAVACSSRTPRSRPRTRHRTSTPTATPISTSSRTTPPTRPIP